MNATSFYLITVIWSVMVLFMDFGDGGQLLHQYQSASYSVVTGRVVSSQVTVQRGGKGGPSYHVNIQYSYSVDGQSFSGSRYRYHPISGGEAWANEVVNAHRAGSEVELHFNPRGPGDAVLSAGIVGKDLMDVFLILPFNMVLLGLWMVSGQRLRAKLSSAVAGGVKIIVDGSRTRVRLPRTAPWLWGFVTTAVASIVAMVAVNVSAGQPSVAGMLRVLGLVIAVGAVVYAWRKWLTLSGIYDLVLDETSGVIVLPKTFGRRAGVKVERANLAKVTVVRVAHQNRGRTYYSYAPVLQLRNKVSSGRPDTGGWSNQMREKLADWSDGWKADAFVEWLREKLNVTSKESATEEARTL